MYSWSESPANLSTKRPWRVGTATPSISTIRPIRQNLWADGGTKLTATFPTAIPSYSNPTASMTLGSAGHDALHANANDDIIAIASKMGKGSSLPNTAGVLRVTNAGTLSTGWGLVQTADIGLGVIGTQHIAGSQITSALIANDTILDADINSAAGIAVSKLAAMANKSLLTSNGTTNSASASPTVSGSFTAEAGLNAGTTGAATGEVKTSSHAKIGGTMFPGGQTTWGYVVLANNTAVAASATLDLGNRNGRMTIWNNTTAEVVQVYTKGGFGSVVVFSAISTGFVVGSDTGTTTAIYWDGSTYRIKNRSAGSQNYAVMLEGA